MKRAFAVLAVASFAAGAALPGAGWAQANPNADQIIRSLSPTDGMNGATRGIRVAPGAPASPAQPVSARAPAAQAPSVSLNVRFATGSAELTPEARQALDELGRALTAAQLAAYRFRIEGHTDTVGSKQENQALSERRAASVVDYLASKYSIDRARLQPIGMGEDGLAVPTADQTPEPRNRRVLVVNLGS